MTIFVSHFFMAAAQMVPTFSISAGGPLGSGKQWLDDYFAQLYFCLH
jgi:NAD dependent epimerase/dehydratase family enzyme